VAFHVNSIGLPWTDSLNIVLRDFSSLADDAFCLEVKETSLGVTFVWNYTS
jgi:hypothetical protein